MDFKAQIEKDLAVFHNTGEFATQMNVWYCDNQYTIPVILDHTAAVERQGGQDHAEGINRIEALAYISMSDLGFVPKKGRNIEFEEAGAVTMYEILKSDFEDGEIILELGAFDE